MTPQPPQDPSDRVNFWGTAIGPAGAGPDSYALVEWQMLGDVHDTMSARGAPVHELAQLNARTDSAVAFLRRLVADGLLPTPQSYLCGLIERFHPVLRRGSDPLRVELLACEFLGALGVPAPGPQEADGAVSQSLVDLMAQIEACGKREALAALRALAVVTAPSARTAASAAADRLAGGGLQDPTWAESIGTPEIGTSCGYLDPAGGQETVITTFAYPGRKPHGLAVLIDHNLGGGFKDCWASGSPGQTRRDYRKVADRHGLEFFDYPPGHARTVLERALACPPCPIEPDQIRDVRDYLPLLRQRVELLPRGDATPVRIPPSKRAAAVRPAPTRNDRRTL